jgi:hypothetical protein
MDPALFMNKETNDLIVNALMSGYLYKKSNSWTEYFRLWGAKWKRKFLVLTNIGLLIFEENQALRKPSKFICLSNTEIFQCKDN